MCRLGESQRQYNDFTVSRCSKQLLQLGHPAASTIVLVPIPHFVPQALCNDHATSVLPRFTPAHASTTNPQDGLRA